MLLMSAAAQPPPLRMDLGGACKFELEQFCIFNDVAQERRSTAATTSYEFL